MRSDVLSMDELRPAGDRRPSQFLRQLRRDPAVRNLRFYLPGAVVVGALLWGMCEHAELRLGAVPLLDPDRPAGLATALIVAWSWLLGYLLNAGLDRRASPLDMVLPLTPRRLWLGRMLAIVAGGAAVVAATAGTIALGNQLAGTRPSLEPGLVSLALHLTTGLILTLAVLQSPQPSLGRLPPHRGYGVLIAASFLGYLALVFALAALPRAWTLAPLAVALALGLRVYRSLPASFAVVPQAAAAAPRRRVARAGWDRRSGGFWRLPAIALRSSLDHFIWLYFPLLAFHGVILADRRESTYFAFFFFTWTVLAGWTLLTLNGLYRLDPLPIPRRRLFALFVLPAFLALAAGYAFGTLRPRADDRRLVLQKCFDDYCVRIPADFYRIAWGGDAPAVGSPWGESARALASAPLEGGELLVYNPYSISRDSSPEFVALQLSRALAAVYGQTLSPEEIRERHLERDADGRVRLRAGGIPLPAAWTELRPQARLRTALVVVLLVGLPWLAFAAGVYRTARDDGRGFAAKRLLPAVFFAVLGVGAGSLAADAVGLVDLPAVSRLAAIGVRQLGDALGTPLLVGLGALLLLGGYRLAETQFLRLEALPGSCGSCRSDGSELSLMP